MPEHAEFELADAALHAQQQPIVGAARVVDAVQIDDARLDQAAQLQQVVPVATVASKPRGVEAQHGADFAGAQPRDEPIEARPGHHAAGGAAEVVVDDLDLREPAAARLLHEVVLAALALQVGLDLRLGGLAHVDDGLAPQHGGGQQISVRSSSASSVLNAGGLQQQDRQLRDHVGSFARGSCPAGRGTRTSCSVDAGRRGCGGADVVTDRRGLGRLGHGAPRGCVNTRAASPKSSLRQQQVQLGQRIHATLAEHPVPCRARRGVRASRRQPR